ncbi:hypothetical protein CEXT_555181 [Caerostris extrusa]|uniref:Uncharacterized protein n=1 Tax=Caerostris extrusa TaxID=172846 RepID=A0AAV4Y3K3_CAEEX|nr:hypothetical protein CEXT_555181 [Caerostris extrusa]
MAEREVSYEAIKQIPSSAQRPEPDTCTFAHGTLVRNASSIMESLSPFNTVASTQSVAGCLTRVLTPPPPGPCSTLSAIYYSSCEQLSVRPGVVNNRPPPLCCCTMDCYMGVAGSQRYSKLNQSREAGISDVAGDRQLRNRGLHVDACSSRKEFKRKIMWWKEEWQ